MLKTLLQRILGRRVAVQDDFGGPHPELLLEIGALIQRRDLMLAGDKLRPLVAAYPNDVDVAMLAGQAALMCGEKDEATLHFERAARLAPGLAAAHAQLGALHREMGRDELAAKAYEAALAAGAASAGLHNNLAAIYLDQGKLEDAQRNLESALRLEPDFAVALNNMGRLRRERREFVQALECFVAAAPVEYDARANVGIVLNDMGEYAQARTALTACSLERPHDVAVLCGLGGACISLGELAEATRNFDRALAQEPGNANACVGLANVALLRGEFGRGWALYEARTQIPKFKSLYASDLPRWQGEPMPGRTLLVSAEQGYGDVLLFARFLPMAARARATVVFRCRPSLLRLFDGMQGIKRVVSDKEPIACDAQVPLLSLAHVLQIGRDSLPGALPYIAPPMALVKKWGERVATDDKPRIGLVWGGNPSRARTGARVPSPDAYAVLRAVDGVTFYNLQVGFGRAELAEVPLALVDCSADLTDFADTAALIANLDLVIAVDTSVAHLAGAMGKPAWLLHSGAADWRWEIDGVDSPWYPSVRIFRRHTEGWPRTLTEVADALTNFVRTRRGKPSL